MRMNGMTLTTLAAVAVLAGGAMSLPVHAQLRGASRAPSKAAKDPKAQALYDWANHMGMLRGVNEVDAIATLELKASGTITVAGQPCTLTEHRVSVNYQEGAMRVLYTCTLRDSTIRKGGEIVSGQYAWDEDGPIGSGLVPGRGKAIPMPNALNERLIRLWSSPQGSVKAAVKGGDQTKVAVTAGKTVVTYPIPGVAGATATATLTSGAANGLCTSFCAERIEVRQGTNVTEFLFTNYADYNPPDNKLDAFYAGRMIEKRNGTTVQDLTVKETQTANEYVVVPVPESVKTAGARQSAAN
jgi:hypothetical protein